MKLIGYARVSTSGQTLDAQLEQLKAHGCVSVFQETMSGARADRPQLKKALDSLGQGDTLVVTRLDRLARSTRDILDIVHTIETSGATLKALAEPWANTTTPTGQGKLISAVLGGLAEFERSLIRERTSEGHFSDIHIKNFFRLSVDIAGIGAFMIALMVIFSKSEESEELIKLNKTQSEQLEFSKRTIELLEKGVISWREEFENPELVDSENTIRLGNSDHSIRELAWPYSVQVTSVASKFAAERTANKIIYQHLHIIGHRPVVIDKADIESRGTIYRVKILATSREDAISFCTEYKSAGGACIVTR